MDNEKKTIKIAIMGAGTVGGGVYKVLQMRKDDMYQRIGVEIEISKILVKSIPFFLSFIPPAYRQRTVGSCLSIFQYGL